MTIFAVTDVKTIKTILLAPKIDIYDHEPISHLEKQIRKLLHPKLSSKPSLIRKLLVRSVQIMRPLPMYKKPDFMQ